MRDFRMGYGTALLAAATICIGSCSVAQAQSSVNRRSSGLASRGTSLRSLPALGSAASSTEAAASTIPGRVGVVRVASVSIRAGRRSGDKALAIATEGTNLAILTEKEGYYGVLMQDSTLGWLPTGDIQLLEYRVQVKIPDSALAPDPAPPAADTTQVPDFGATDDRTSALLHEAFTYLGVPYVWAGNTRQGLDCSAFLKNVYAATWGLQLPRHSGDQAKLGTPVPSVADLRPGDRLYFDMGRRGEISHCGIYMGNGYFIHASSNHHCVAIDLLTTGNYWKCLVAARRDQ